MATGDAGNAKIGKTNGVPGSLVGCLLAANELADIERGRRDHGFDHIAGLWHPDRKRRLLERGDGDADADAEDVAVFRIALVLVDDDEPARIG